MNKFLPLLLCLLLSIFTVARATKSAHEAAPDTRRTQKNPTGQEADVKTLLNDENTGDESPSDGDNSAEPASSDDGEKANDDGGGDVPGDEDTGDDDTGDDDGGNGSGGDQGK
jgi:hypothetical protein